MLVAGKPDWEALEAKYAPLTDLAWQELDEDQQRERLMLNFEDYSSRNVKIRAKSGKLEPLIMNRSQMFLHDVAQRQLEETGRVRIYLLKGRQFGGSTYITARLYWKATHRFGYRVYQMAHAQEATDELFAMLKRMHERCHPDLKPQTGTSNVKELKFTALDGGYEVSTAGARAPGRSKSMSAVHWSEVAQTPNADDHKAGLLQTVPEADDTEVWMEGTAKGVGGTFHQGWLDAVEDPSDEVVAVFIPWFWHDEYRAPVPHDFEPTAEERELMTLYGLDPEQIVWRRRKIKTLKPSDGGNAEDLFKQEYPNCWQEAFLHSGRTVFNISDLVAAEQRCVPGARFDVELIKVNNKHQAKLKPRKDGKMIVWKMPVPDHRYVIGADTAEGLPTGDYSSAHVVDVLDGSTVAAWHGHAASDDFGDILIAMGSMYNKAQIAVETNFSDAVLFRLKHQHYVDIFQREQLDSQTNHKMKKYGWKTTKQSKRSMIDFLDEDLRDGLELRDAQLIKEMTTFVINDDQSMGASQGCHDDRVISRAIACAVWRMHAKYRKNVTENKLRKEIIKAEEEKRKGQKVAASFFSGQSSSLEWSKKQKLEQRRRELRASGIDQKYLDMIEKAVQAAIKDKNLDVPWSRRKPEPELNKPIGAHAEPTPRKVRQFGG